MMRRPQLVKLPKSSKKIIVVLSEYGRITQKDIISLTGIPAKTVRYALKRLSDEKLIVSLANLEDMRSAYHMLNPDFSPILMENYIQDALENTKLTTN